MIQRAASLETAHTYTIPYTEPRVARARRSRMHDTHTHIHTTTHTTRHTEPCEAAGYAFEEAT